MLFVFPVLCIALAITFMYVEYKKQYVPAVCLKGMASLCFVLFGILSGKLCGDQEFSKLVIIGLILGFVADILLNLRFVFEKKGQIIFLVGIVVFLAGHIFYLAALIPHSSNLVASLIAGIVLTAITLYLIFKKITAKPAFKIFGVFYIGAIMLMTCVSVGILISNLSAHSVIFSLGAVSFLISDIVLILNTFGSKTKQSLRVTNLSLYYIGQLLIGLSLQFLK